MLYDFNYDINNSRIFLDRDICNNPINIEYDDNNYSIKWLPSSLKAWGTGNLGQYSGRNDFVLVKETNGAFAGLHSDGTVEVWGDPTVGGATTGGTTYKGIPQDLRRVVSLYSNEYAFVAVKADGSIVSWGSIAAGGNIELSGSYIAVYNTDSAFAALQTDGSVTVWGDSATGGVNNTGAQISSGVISITANKRAFAALKSNGTIEVWGDATTGGSNKPVVNNAKAIYATDRAFAVVLQTTIVEVWGDPEYGGAGNTSTTIVDTATYKGKPIDLINVSYIYSTKSAFAALRLNGAVVVWGAKAAGGADVDGTTYTGKPTFTGAVSLKATDAAFAALKSDGTVVSWGSKAHGGAQQDGADYRGIPSLSSITSIYATSAAFAVLSSTGYINCWGHYTAGGKYGGQGTATHPDGELLEYYGLANNHYGIQTIIANRYAFIGMGADKYNFLWGAVTYGGYQILNNEAVSTNNGYIRFFHKAYATKKGFIGLMPTNQFQLSDYYYSAGGSKYVTPSIECYDGDLLGEIIIYVRGHRGITTTELYHNTQLNSTQPVSARLLSDTNALDNTQNVYYIIYKNDTTVVSTSTQFSIVPRRLSLYGRKYLGSDNINLYITNYNSVYSIYRNNQLYLENISGVQYIDSTPALGDNFYSLRAISSGGELYTSSNSDSIYNYDILKQNNGTFQYINNLEFDTYRSSYNKRVHIVDDGIILIGEYIGDLSYNYPSLTSTFASNGAFQNVAFIMKTDFSGNEIWCRRINALYSHAYQIEVVSSGAYAGIYMAGAYETPLADFGLSSGAWTNAYIIKYDLSGIGQWARGIDGNFHDNAAAVSVSDNGIFIGINTASAYLKLFKGNFEILQSLTDLYFNKVSLAVFCLDANGNPRSGFTPIKIANEQDGNLLMDVKVVGNRLFVAGTIKFNATDISMNNNTDNSAFLAVYDINGSYQFTKRIITSGSDITTAIESDSTGIYICGVYTNSVIIDAELSDILQATGGSGNMFLIKYNNDTNLSLNWAKRLDNPTLQADEIAASIKIYDDIIYLSGRYIANQLNPLREYTKSGGFIRSADIYNVNTNYLANFIAKFTTSGDFLDIQKTFDSMIDDRSRTYDRPYSIDAKNNYVVQSYICSDNNKYNLVIFRELPKVYIYQNTTTATLGQISININYNRSDASSYKIYRNSILIDEISGSALIYNDSSIPGFGQYQYYVEAITSGQIYTSKTISVIPVLPSFTAIAGRELGEVKLIVNSYNSPYKIYRNGQIIATNISAIEYYDNGAEDLNNAYYIVATNSTGIDFTSQTVYYTPDKPSITVSLGNTLGVHILVGNINKAVSYSIYHNNLPDIVDISNTSLTSSVQYTFNGGIQGINYFKIVAKTAGNKLFTSNIYASYSLIPSITILKSLVIGQVQIQVNTYNQYPYSLYRYGTSQLIAADLSTNTYSEFAIYDENQYYIEVYSLEGNKFISGISEVAYSYSQLNKNNEYVEALFNRYISYDIYNPYYGGSMSKNKKSYVSKDAVYVAGNYIGDISNLFPPLTYVRENTTFLLKMSLSGEYIWAIKMDTLYSFTSQLQVVESGNYQGIYIVGLFEGNNSLGLIPGLWSSAYIMKYSLTGQRQWSRSLDSSFFDFATALNVSEAGIFLSCMASGNNFFVKNEQGQILVNVFDIINGKQNILIVGLDQNGVPLTNFNTILIKGNHESCSIKDLTVYGNYIYFCGDITGANADISYNNSGQSAIILKYDKTGNYITTKTLFSTAADIATSITANENGVYVAGTYNNIITNEPGLSDLLINTNNANNIFFIKYNNDDNMTIDWAKRLDNNINGVNEVCNSFYIYKSFIYVLGSYSCNTNSYFKEYTKRWVAGVPGQITENILLTTTTPYNALFLAKYTLDGTNIFAQKIFDTTINDNASPTSINYNYGYLTISFTINNNGTNNIILYKEKPSITLTLDNTALGKVNVNFDKYYFKDVVDIQSYSIYRDNVLLVTNITSSTTVYIDEYAYDGDNKYYLVARDIYDRLFTSSINAITTFKPSVIATYNNKLLSFTVRLYGSLNFSIFKSDISGAIYTSTTGAINNRVTITQQIPLQTYNYFYMKVTNSNGVIYTTSQYTLFNPNAKKTFSDFLQTSSTVLFNPYLTKFAPDSTRQNFNYSYNKKSFIGASSVYHSGVYVGSLTSVAPELTTSTNYSGFLLNMDMCGNVIWAKKFSNDSDFIVSQIEVVESGLYQGIYLCGSYKGTAVTALSLPSATTYNSFLVKFNLLGTVEWSRIIDGSSTDYGMALSVSTDGCFIASNVKISQSSFININDSGGILIASIPGSYYYNNPNIYQTLIVRFNNTGQHINHNVIPATTANDIIIYDLKAIGGDGYYITGYNFNTTREAYITKYNISNQLQWNKVIGSAASDVGLSLSINTSGIYVSGVYGNSNSSITAADLSDVLTGSTTNSTCIFLIHYKTNGQLGWAKKIDTAGSSVDDVAYSVYSTSDHIYITGKYGGTTNYLFETYKDQTTGIIKSYRLLDNTVGGTSSFLIKYKVTDASLLYAFNIYDGLFNDMGLSITVNNDKMALIYYDGNISKAVFIIADDALEFPRIPMSISPFAPPIYVPLFETRTGLLNITNGSGNYSYAWYELSGSAVMPLTYNSNALTVTNNLYWVSPTDKQVTYRAVVNDLSYNLTATIDNIVTYERFVPNLNASITPQSLSLPLDSSGAISVIDISGTIPGTYSIQWYKSNRLYDTSYSLIVGASGESINVINNRQYEEYGFNSILYKAVVTDPYSSIELISDAKYEGTIPLITATLNDYYGAYLINLMSSQLLQIDASGGRGSYKYEWYEISGNDFELIPGASTYQYTVDNIYKLTYNEYNTTYANHNYRSVVYDPGKPYYKVTNDVNILFITYYALTTNKFVYNSNLAPGETIGFFVLADGGKQPYGGKQYNFKYYRKNDNDDNYYLIQDSSNNTLNLTNNNDYAYEGRQVTIRCDTTDALRSKVISDYFSFYFEPYTPNLQIQRTDTNQFTHLAFGDSYTISVIATTGDGNYTYSWYYVYNNKEYLKETNTSGQFILTNNYNITVPSVILRIRAVDGAGIISDPYDISFTADTVQPITFTQNITSVEMYPRDTQDLIISNVSGGKPGALYTYLWSHSNNVVLDESSNTLSLLNDFRIDRTYKCTISDEVNNTTTAEFQIISKSYDPIEIQPIVDIRIPLTETVNITPDISGGNGEYTYLWYALINGYFRILSISETCVFNNNYLFAGTEDKNITVYVRINDSAQTAFGGILNIFHAFYETYTPISAEQNLTEATLQVNDTITLSVSNVTGGVNANYIYDWYFDAYGYTEEYQLNYQSSIEIANNGQYGDEPNKVVRFICVVRSELYDVSTPYDFNITFAFDVVFN